MVTTSVMRTLVRAVFKVAEQSCIVLIGLLIVDGLSEFHDLFKLGRLHLGPGLEAPRDVRYAPLQGGQRGVGAGIVGDDDGVE